MNNKDCLILVSILFWPNNRFDTDSLVYYLSFYDLYAFYTGKHLRYDQLVKSTSNDLNRLNKMGLLGRRPKKRMIRRWGKSHHEGIKYEYSVSSQGIKHFGYLLNTDPSSASLIDQLGHKRIPKVTGDELLDLMIWKRLTGGRPDYKTDFLYEYEKIVRQKGGRFNRFRVSNDRKRLIAICMFSAKALGEKFKDVFREAEMFMALRGDLREEDSHRSRILDAIYRPDNQSEQIIKVTKALMDRAVYLTKMKAINEPVTAKDVYIILEIEKMLRSHIA